MLVLSRKKNEAIRVGDVVTVTVIEIRGDSVRLGIEAPKEVDVHREEVWRRIKEQGDVTESSQGPPGGGGVGGVMHVY